MDTVLGLSLTSTAVGWVLVEGRNADGTILDHDDFEVHTGGGVRAVNTSERATDAVLRAQEVTARHDQRVHVIGVTWSDDAAAEAALLLESLTGAGFDNVVPIRLHEAADMLALGIAPVVGYDKTAVCVLDGESTTVVMVDTCDGEPQTAIKDLSGGADRLIGWLTKMFRRSSWRPGGVVVVGADDDLDALSGSWNRPCRSRSSRKAARTWPLRAELPSHRPRARNSPTPRWSRPSTESESTTGGHDSGRTRGR